MSKPDGGPAFPLSSDGSHGMTLRQWYAGMAMLAYVVTGTESFTNIPSLAYHMADEMLSRESKE